MRTLTGVYKYIPRGVIALVLRYKITPMEAGVQVTSSCATSVDASC